MSTPSSHQFNRKHKSTPQRVPWSTRTGYVPFPPENCRAVAYPAPGVESLNFVHLTFTLIACLALLLEWWSHLRRSRSNLQHRWRFLCVQQCSWGKAQQKKTICRADLLCPGPAFLTFELRLAVVWWGNLQRRDSDCQPRESHRQFWRIGKLVLFKLLRRCALIPAPGMLISISLRSNCNCFQPNTASALLSCCFRAASALLPHRDMNGNTLRNGGARGLNGIIFPKTACLA